VTQPPGFARAELVADLARYLTQWERILGSGRQLFGPELAGLQRQSFELQARARSVGFGGVAHHLAQCARFVAEGRLFDPAGLPASLKDLSEMAWQAKQELLPNEKALVEQALHERAAAAHAPAGGSPADIAPPRMITYVPSISGGSGPVVDPGPPRPAPTPQALPPSSLAPVITPALIRPPQAPPAPHTGAPSPPGAMFAAPAALPPLGAQGPAPLPPQVPPVVTPPAPAPPQPSQNAPPAGGDGPKLAVRTMFGLRAFGRNPPRSQAPAQPNAEGPSLLGLRGIGQAASPRETDRPPMLSNSLPPLPGHPGAITSPSPSAERHPTGIQQLLSRFGREPTRKSRSKREAARAPRARPGRSSSRGGWWVGAFGALAIGGVLIGMVVGWNRMRESSDRPRPLASGAVASAGPSSTSTSTALPPSAPVATASKGPGKTDEQLGALLAKAHGQGGAESPELKAWVDHQAAIQAKLLETGKCEGSAAACRALFKAREEMTNPPSRRVDPRKKNPPPAGAAGGLRSRWLAGLKMPSIPVEDDPRVQRFFEKYTDTQVGRALFESMLFRCGAYRDRIQETLIRYELPQSLLAVVFAESGCDPLAKSPVGAEGLWQFMPEAGRAYHLHIIEDIIDERHSPPKSTEAAIHFLADLYKKFGSWDLVFAAYNMGPYGLAARMERAGGGDVGFWDLLDADMLPEETSAYVPIIEAFALILENLQRLKFAGTQMRAPEVTADLDAPPGTRLGLVARAAATSVNQIRLMNLDIKGDVVPRIPGQLFPVQVSKDVVWQARDTLQDLIGRQSHDDECVPAAFDWGKQRFTTEMEEECRKKLGAPLPRATSQPQP
jgi:hypothetical protein